MSPLLALAILVPSAAGAPAAGRRRSAAPGDDRHIRCAAAAGGWRGPGPRAPGEGPKSPGPPGASFYLYDDSDSAAFSLGPLPASGKARGFLALVGPSGTSRGQERRLSMEQKRPKCDQRPA